MAGAHKHWCVRVRVSGGVWMRRNWGVLLPVVGVTVGVNTRGCEGVKENVCQNLCVRRGCDCLRVWGHLNKRTNVGVCAREGEGL